MAWIARARLVTWPIMLALVVAMILRAAGPAAAQPAPTPSAEAAASSAKGVDVSLAEVFFIQRHPSTGKVELLGSAIIWFLLGLSAVNLSLMGVMALDSRRKAIAPEEQIGRASALLRDRRAAELMDFTRTDESYFGRVMHAALEEQPHGFVAMLRAAEDAGEELTLQRLRRIEPLNIIGNVAPMIGLFGTVYGMIVAFQEIVSAGGTPDPVNLAAGIGTALVTTFWGLIVAIPALAVYAFLRNRIDELTAHASREVDRLLEVFRPDTARDAA